MAQLKNTEINDTGFLQLPIGTTAQRPSTPSPGMLRFNTDTASTEWYDDVYNKWFPTGLTPVVATGGTIINYTQDGIDYRVHAFTSTGNSTFNVTRGGDIEYIIVGGGGGGGLDDAGGGGGGGVLIGHLAIIQDAYPVTVGAGGARAGSGDTSGGRTGESSSAFNYVALGGGGGSHQATDVSAKNGASGGGGGHAQGETDPSQPANGIGGQGHRGKWLVWGRRRRTISSRPASRWFRRWRQRRNRKSSWNQWTD